MADDEKSPISAAQARTIFAPWKALPAVVLAVSGGPDSVALMWLAALKEREAACAALGEVTRKYPRASAGVKAAVDREQKRVKC